MPTMHKPGLSSRPPQPWIRSRMPSPPEGLGLRVEGSGPGSGFRLEGSGFRVRIRKLILAAEPKP